MSPLVPARMSDNVVFQNPLKSTDGSLDAEGKHKHHGIHIHAPHLHLGHHKKVEPEPEPEDQVMQVSEEALGDLSFAFMACDIDRNGSVEGSELYAILHVLGSKATQGMVLACMQEAKDGFVAWCEKMEVDTWEDGADYGADHPDEDHRHGKRDHTELSMEKKAHGGGFVGRLNHSPIMQKYFIAQTANVLTSPLKLGHRMVVHSVNGAAKFGAKAADSAGAAMSKVGQALKKDGDLLFDTDSDENEEEEEIDELYIEFPEFIYLMTSHVVEKILPGGDWHKSAYEMRMLRNAFDTADVDGDNQLEFEELEMVVMSLHPGHNMTHEDIEYLWDVINPDEKDFIEFFEFVKGMVKVRSDTRLEGKISLTEPNKWELLSLIIDTPVSRDETNKILAGYSFMERMGVMMLDAMMTPMDKADTKMVIDRAVVGHLHWLSDMQKHKMAIVHAFCMFQACSIGFFSSIATCSMENFLGYYYETDGAMDFYCISGRTLDAVPGNEEAADSCISTTHSILLFWLFNILSLAVAVGLEIAFLMLTAVQNAVRISWALDYRLMPLNKDRAFVADSLVRAAFEMGNPENPVLGVDPGRETTGSGRIRIAFMMLLYRGKIVLTGTILKLIVAAIWSRPWHVWIKPWMVLPATCFWDSLVASSIMDQAKMRGIGVSTSVEVFNEIMEDHVKKNGPLTEECEIQVARACGVAIVKHGNMYPTMEMLLRHAIQFLGLKGKPVVTTPGIIDNAVDFVADLPKMRKEEQIIVLQVFLLALSLNGKVDHHEAAVWKEVVESASEGVAVFDMNRVHYMCQRYRAFVPMTAEMVRACFDIGIPVFIPPVFYVTEFLFSFQNCLTC